MARTSSLLTSTVPAIVLGEVTIAHVQLRDVIICPREAGIVNYVRGRSIIEHDLHSPDVVPRRVADLTFIPNTLSSLNLDISDSPHTLLAAGGQDADIYVSLHSPLHNRALWHFSRKLTGSINNSILLSRAYDSSPEPQLIVSNNDCTVRIYKVPLRREPQDLPCCGTLRLEEPVNHSSISPDGRTLLSAGDSPRIYLHSLSGSAQLAFDRTSTLHVPPSIPPNHHPFIASFSTAWSADGLKFAVACQEGVVAIWDIRSTKPMKVLYTSRARGDDSKWIDGYPWGWTRGNSRAPARNVKFGCGGIGGRAGHEIMTYTENTNLLHVLDAQTFETEEVIHVPNIGKNFTSAHPPAHQSHHLHRRRHSATKPGALSARRDTSIVGMPPLHSAIQMSLSVADPMGGSGDLEGVTMDLEEQVDIAGVCFDPAGDFLYVATTDGIAEWAVRGSGKRRGRSGQLLYQGNAARPRDNFDVSPLPTQQFNNRGAPTYAKDFWGDGTNHSPRRSAPLADPSPPRQRNFFDFLRITPRLVDTFQPILPLYPWRWTLSLFTRRIAARTVNVSPARDEDRYAIAPPTEAEVAAAMQRIADNSTQPGQALAGAPRVSTHGAPTQPGQVIVGTSQVSMQGPPTQITPGKGSAVCTEEPSYVIGCCGFYVVRRPSTSHQ
ncbi:hypothetical protein K503DRAFT_805294 [Rhizopogon vinicolor AM-OR11-026]|uniref:DUF2415 domain-containing protein n=1 Tax=Rhizopogon vinicolor AM-OR11-026 TaxID=1314800 RepID=A0A1B7MIC5_9AGAM|nr:hypothetical protein K503DRAFT_805294 [Rhizopogon vinicolor AM-OR11-026]